MSIVHGPNLVRDGLVLYLDGGNNKRIPTENKLESSDDLLNTTYWGTTLSSSYSTSHIESAGYDSTVDSEYYLLSSSIMDNSTTPGATFSNTPGLLYNTSTNMTEANSKRAFSVYLKKGTHSRVLVSTSRIGWPFHFLVDLETGTIVDENIDGVYASSLTHKEIKYVGDGWYRVEGGYTFSSNYNETRNNKIDVYLANPNTNDSADSRYPLNDEHTFDGTEYIYVAKPQLEERSFATEYTNGQRTYPAGNYDWYDLSGNSNNAVLETDISNGHVIKKVDGVDGSFTTLTTGSNSFIEISTPNGSNLDVTPYDSFTVEAVFAFNSLDTTRNTCGILGRGSTNGSHGIGVEFNNDTTTLQIGTRLSDSLTQIKSTKTIEKDKIYHAVLTYTPTKQYEYLNGEVLKPNGNDTNPPIGKTFSSNNWSILSKNAIPGGNSADVSGSIYLARIYNRALSAEEIKQNYNALRGRFGL